MADRIQFRYDIKENWERYNPILLKGEVAYETDGEQYKIGDGINDWKSLKYRGLDCLDQTGDSKLSPMSQSAVTKEIEQLTKKRSILNISQETNNYQFADKATARKAVPAALRAVNQILIYQTTERTVIEYCVAESAVLNNDEIWQLDNSWKTVGSGGGALNVSEEKQNYAFASMADARNAVQPSDRKQGQFITYKMDETGWVFEQFTDADISKWTENDSWTQITTSGHLKALTDYLTQELEKFDNRINESLEQVNKDVEHAISDTNTKVENKLNSLDTFLKDELKKFNTSLSAKADGCRLTGENKLQLTSGGKDVGDAIELPSGIINLSHKDNKEFTNAENARNATKQSDRIIGQVITYKLSDGTWYIDQFIGDTIGSWANNGSWKQYALKDDLAPLVQSIADMQVKVDAFQSDIIGKIDGLESEDVDENNMAILGLSNGQEVARVVIPKGGGSGTGPSTGVVMKMKALGATNIVVSKGEDAIVKYNWTSIDTTDDSQTGPGTLSVLVNGFAVYTEPVNQGDNEVNLKDYINDGSNVVKVRVTDSYNNYRTLNYTIQVTSLVLTSTFSDDTLYEREPVQFRYIVQGTGRKTIRFWVNGKEIASETTDSTNKQLTKNLTGLRSGTNSIKVVAESTVGGYNLKSNELYYEFIYVGLGLIEPAIVISYNKEKVRQFEIIEIPYVVYDPNNQKASVDLLVNNIKVQTLMVDRKRQVWSYLANEKGTFQMQIRCGNVSKSVTFEVIASEYDITEEIANLKYKASSVGKSNSTEDRASWKYGDYDAVFDGFTWIDDGWKRDADNNTHLRLIGDSKVTFGIKPFGVNILQEGMTFTVEFATSDVVNTDAVIMSCFADGIGIEIKPNHIRLKSAQSEISADLDSSTKVSVSFVVQKSAENRLMLLFIDGIMSGVIQYASNENFTQINSPGFVAHTGGRACILSVYAVRWYNNSLGFNQVFNNYLFDIENFDKKVERFKFNAILDDFGNIDYTKALDYLPCLTFIGDLPTYKGDKKVCNLLYEDKKNPKNSFSALNIQNDVQGTSSQAYPRKNYKFKFLYKTGDVKQKADVTLTETGEKIEAYSMLGTQIPAKTFCMKADFAESSGTHNTGFAVLVDDALRKLGYTIPPQADDKRIRTTVFGYPCLIFHKQTEADQPTFLGKYNFNDDKSSEHVFGFGEGMECWEFLNNTSDICLFKAADFDVMGMDGKGNEIPQWQNDLEGRFPDGNTDATNIKSLWQWVVSCIGNPSKFKEECKNHFNEKWLVFYCLTNEIAAGVDQRGKNQMLTTYGERGATGELIWYFIYYDNDTIFGVNNEGRLTFNPYVESQDTFGSAHVWNAWNSELWKLVEAAYKDEITSLYASLVTTDAMSLKSTLKVFQNRFADLWSETVYNNDGNFKYIMPLVEGGDDSYLYSLQGSRSRHRIWWLTNRFFYMDSKYFTGDYKAKFAHIRVNTPAGNLAVQPKVELNVTINRPMYVRSLVSSYQLNAGRGVTGKTYKMVPPNIQYNNTEVFIYGARGIKSLGDLSPAYPGESVNVVEAIALEDLIIGSTKAGYENNILKTLSLGNNTLLKEINVANCKVLNQALELGRCYSLKKIEARGSAITGVALPAKGILEEMYLPATVTSVYLKNQPYLKNFTVEGYSNINTIVVENVPNKVVDGYNLCKQCVAIAGNKLSKVRIIGIDAVDASSTTIFALTRMTGEDAEGVATQTAVVTGKLHLATVTQSALEAIHLAFPDLIVTYDQKLDVIEFEDVNIKEIAVRKYDLNGDGELSKDEIRTVPLTKDIFIGSGGVKFNEAHYWGGDGSMVNDITTLKEVSVQAGKTSLQDLPALEKVMVYSDFEDRNQEPKFGFNTMRNCYSAKSFVVGGRYKGNQQGGVILGEVFDSANNVTYQRPVLITRGTRQALFTAADGDVALNKALFNEKQYNWGKDLEKIVINQCRGINVPYFENLKSIEINGISKTATSLDFSGNDFPTLDSVSIDDANQGACHTLIIGPNVRNWKIGKLYCNNLPNSVLRLQGIRGFFGKGRDVVLDFPETYQPSQLQVIYSEYYGVYTISDETTETKVILRSPYLIPLTQRDYLGWSWIRFYVPDGLVSTYKAATNWKDNASFILPISSLG